MNKVKSIWILGICILAGCFPALSTSVKSPAIYGRILDASTKAPIQGAKITFVDRPTISCDSGPSGSFVIDATHNVHFLKIMGPCTFGAWPIGQQYTRWEISKDGYETRVFDVGDKDAVREVSDDGDVRKVDLKDVLLIPEKKTPNSERSTRR